MKKIIYLFLLFLLFFLICYCFLNNNSNELLRNRAIKTKTGKELLNGYDEYTNMNLDFYHEKKYLVISEEKEIFIKKENSNYYFIEKNKNSKIDKKILIGEKIKELKLNNNYLYYVKRNLVKEKDELYRLDVNKNTNKLLIELNWIDNYVISEKSIVLVEMGQFYEYNIENKEIKKFNASGNLLDYDGKNLYLYDDSLKNKMCFYKLNKNSVERKKCDLEVFLNKEKEVLIEKPIKLEDGIYALKFSKLKKVKIGSEDFLIFGVPIFRKPIIKVSPDTKFYFKVIDLKNKKVSEKIKYQSSM